MKPQIIRRLLLSSAFIFIFSTYLFSIDLNSAYKLAGQNRSELEAVIKHYSVNPSDSSKRKAAIFLIENMDGHLSYQSTGWDNYYNALNSLFSQEISKKELLGKYELLTREYADKFILYKEIPDLKIIKADYLIKNIDSAFEGWRSPYARHLSFDQFCEYLLPYRIGDESLTEWRDYYKKEVLPAFWKKLNILVASDTIKSKDLCTILRNYYVLNTKLQSISPPNCNAILLANTKVGTCNDWSHLATFTARALGVPVAIDFVHHWASRSNAHNWSALIDEKNKSLDFELNESIEVGKHLSSTPNRLVAKVFRNTYGKQKESLSEIHGVEDIPNEFISPFIKDVSKEYFSGIDIPIQLASQIQLIKKQFVYICVFNDKDWVPVYWSKIINQKAIFKNMNSGVAYIPAYYIDGKFKATDQPLIVKKDNAIIQLKPNLKRKQTILLNRKYPDLKLEEFRKRMIGGKFQVSNDSTFKDAIDIYEIKNKPEACFQTISININKSYKYFRYLSVYNGDISEIELYNNKSEKIIEGRIIGSEPKEGYKLENTFDGQVLTCFESLKNNGAWVGLEFSTPQLINRLVYLVRNDDNFIRDGELYELFYWDNNWIPLGRQTGSLKTQTLVYSNVPTNALFLLRNLTKGQEERIFTYENGKQVWW